MASPNPVRKRSRSTDAHSCGNGEPHEHSRSRWAERASVVYDDSGTPIVGFRKSLGLELRHHLPFTSLAVIVTTALVGLLSLGRSEPWRESSFQYLHYLHLFFSAIATTSVFWRYGRRASVAVAVGVTSALLFCTLSDIVLPSIGGWLMGIPVAIEIEAIESPVYAIGASLAGALFGFVHLRYLSVYSHSAHVFASSFASLLYVLSHSDRIWFGWGQVPAIVVVLFIAVFFPCCMSDFVMPVACSHCHFGKPSRKREPSP